MSPRLCALEWEQLLCLRQCTRLIALSLLLKLHYSEAWGRCFCSALFYYCAGKVVVASRGVRNQVQPHAGGNASPPCHNVFWAFPRGISAAVCPPEERLWSPGCQA